MLLTTTKGADEAPFAAQLTTIASHPDLAGCGSIGQFAELVPPPAAGAAPAPLVVNTGHDFAKLRWNKSEDARGYRLIRSRWSPAFVVHYAPDLSGVYYLNGTSIHVCTQRDGARGSGRLFAHVQSEDGGLGALATAHWDIEQGGYAGPILYSNASGVSGRSLWYGHRNGVLEFSAVSFNASADAYAEAATIRADPGGAAAADAAGVCRLMPPAAGARQQGAPELTGLYFSNYNESIAACSANGSLVITFSGVGLLQVVETGRGRKKQASASRQQVGGCREQGGRSKEQGAWSREWGVGSRE